MVEILLDAPLRNQRRNSVFVLNIYSNPRDSRQHFKIILKKATDLAGPRPLVVVGDFNVPYGLWGYVYDTTKGRNLWQDANEIDLTLVTDKAFPARIGNSVTRGKTPDFTFIKNVKIRFRKFREEPGRARAPTSLEEFGSKSYQKHTVARTLHEATRSHTVDVLVSKLIQKYLPVRRDGDLST
ncbi:hypothetical protein HPB49_020903 [Dermacentor silvarum]|uniref:Uncharacterized protein n=1 Tax=Dermacentor silvarum TaxID=543639 RepID=A0ACB8CSY0_DERSI|nr:hypothetical protein HPB49_020903 [Dermacentor silvarum]